MAAISYYFALPFIYLLSALPFPLLYLLSDMIYILLFRIAGYRKEIVMVNLRNAFPDKTEKELGDLCQKFYHHLCDLFLETFKTLTISKSNMLSRCKFSPAAEILFNKLAEEKKSAILVMGHLGNWEWSGNSFSLLLQQQLYVIYHPLKNPYFNDLMYKMRTRFGTKLISMKDTYRDMLAQKNELNVTAFIADQTPHPANAYWTTFLNQDTPVFKGPEKIAQKMNYPVVYAWVKKVNRGYYEIFAEILVKQPSDTAENEISEQHTRRVEKDILKQPEAWLWSHRRWKHKRENRNLIPEMHVGR